MAERAAGQLRQTFGQFDYRLVREAGEDDVFEFFELLTQRGIDTRVAMAKQIDPPGTDAIKIAFAVKVMQPDAFSTGNRNQRQGVAARVLLHLRARVPDGSQAAMQELSIVQRVEYFRLVQRL